MSEWPLVVFTLAIQSAAGLALTAALFDRAAAQVDEAVIRPLGLAVFPLAAVGLLASTFHLGRPLSAWKSLLNLGHSRLSLEVVLTVLFVGAAFLYSQAWWTHRAEHRITLGMITGIAAVAAVASSAAIYLIPSQPAWNSGWVPISFLGTTLVLGGTVSAAFLRNRDVEGLIGYSFAIATAGSIALLAAAVWMHSTLSGSTPDPAAATRLQAARHLLWSRYQVWFWLHLLLAGVVPIMVAAQYTFSKSFPSWLAIASALAAACGAAIGRTLMYLVGTRPAQF